MPSPFPGMNPYLEQDDAWHDFHKRFLPLAAELLTPQIRPNFIARLDETIYSEQRESFIEIRDHHTREVVTVVELLSPSNKRNGADREQYLAKRRRLFASWVNLVEIDLLRGGPRLPLENLQPCDYYILVSRYGERPQAGVWPVQLREPLPVIPIPLRGPHADASLDLQQMLHRLYDAAGYEDYIYGGEPDPPLAPDDAAWARSLIPAR